MKKYEVKSECQIEGVDKVVGDIVELDPAIESTATLIESGTIAELSEAVPSHPKGEITPEGFFSLEVKFNENASEADKEGALAWIKDSAQQLAESPKDLFPAIIDAFTVKRD